jgi:hypothetical protein
MHPLSMYTAQSLLGTRCTAQLFLATGSPSCMIVTMPAYRLMPESEYDEGRGCAVAQVRRVAGAPGVVTAEAYHSKGAGQC